MATHQVYLHSGRTIWPEHRPVAEVQELQATTPEAVWEGTYQGRPTAPGGTIFKRIWWHPAGTRYDYADQRLQNHVIRRYISFDTANTGEDQATEDHAYSAYVVGELWPDYRLALRYAWWDRLEFPELVDAVSHAAGRWNKDEKLAAVLIEDRVSGTSALQTLRAISPAWLRPLLVPFNPTTDKATRARQAAVWCKNECILLPRPGLQGELYWLVDFQDQLFDFPRAAHADLVDAFSQLVLYLEYVLEEGWRQRMEVKQ